MKATNMKYILKNTLGNYIITDPYIKESCLYTDHFQVLTSGTPSRDYGTGAWSLTGIQEFKPYMKKTVIPAVAIDGIGRFITASISQKDKTVTVGCSTVSFDKLKEVYDAAFPKS
jgi:hypothetical protein